MDQEEIIGLVKKFALEISKSLPVEDVILYGSWARQAGRFASADSDIDVAVFLSRVEKHLETAQQLYKHTRDIDLRIEPILLYKHPDRSGFAQQVLREGIHVHP